MSKNWKKTKNLCRGTVRSIENQSCNKYTAHLVCNKDPKNISDKSNINTIKVNYEDPCNKKEMMWDKARKVRKGVHEAPKKPGDYVMVLDADDRVNKNLVQYVVNNTKSDVLYANKGYVWPFGRGFCFKWKKFHLLCGSSHLIRYNGSNMPSGPEDDKNYLVNVPHGEIKKVANKRGLTTSEVPFRASCYITDVEDNWSGVSFLQYLHKKRFIKKVAGFRFLTATIRKSFAISDEYS